jgi:hypothetical protein
MDNFDLLEYVLPEGGYYCVLALESGDFAGTKLVATREEAQNLVDKYLAKGQDVYFAVAKFKDPDKGRTQVNVQALKAVWLDIDCGEKKAEVNEKTGRPDGYIDKEAGAKKLREFCETVGLPQPTLVNSGRGLHVYWALDRAVTKEEWRPVASRLRQLCDKQEFYVDPSVFEEARVLRVPGTLNYKDDPPKPVSVITTAPEINFDELKDILGVKETVALDETAPRRKSMLMGKLQDNVQSSFAKIMKRSAGNTGCQQLLDCYVNRATLSEPRWFDALSVAAHCYDRGTAIHILSEGHPDYNREKVEEKVEHIEGPHSCAVFERTNPGGCDGCPHKGRITNPISLGKELVEFDEEEDEEQVNPEPEVEEVEDEYLDRDLLSLKPFLPDNYAKGKHGGIYYLDPNDDEGGPKLVYEHDLFVIKRMNDPAEGDTTVLRLHTPKDGVKIFFISNIKITQNIEVKKELSKHGVMADEAQFKKITAYVIRAIKALQTLKKADIMRKQFGWADNDTKFIVGDREITVDGVYYSPPSSITQSMAPYFEPAGTLEEWKKAFGLYGREGMELQAFGAMSGFGSILLKYTGQKGVMINFVHRYAGTGKTTILRMANSICGHPEKLLGTVDDTKVAKITKIGILNNIVNTVDEITNTSADDFSELAYAYSQGKGKDKSERDANKLRINDTTWNTISLTSANASFYDKSSSAKAVADGEMMRLLEFQIDYTDQTIISVEEGKDMFDHVLNSNYGHAIEPFIQYIIANSDEVVETLLRVQAKVDKKLKFSSRERIWSAAVAANITAGLVASNVGLLQITNKEGKAELIEDGDDAGKPKTWDLGTLYEKVVEEVGQMSLETKAPLSSASATIADYVYRHNNNILVVEDGVDNRSHLPSSPIREPRGELVIRYEPDTKLMFIKVGHFNQDCVKYQAAKNDTIKELKQKGILVTTKNKRLAKGMDIDVGLSVRCMVLDCSNSEFFDIENLVMPEKKDESGEGAVSD